MTIHSDWSRILHEECPGAFHAAIPRGKHAVGIIDGHLQLMRMHGDLGAWPAFIEAQFLRPIRTLFQAGCPTVVLCFDSYDRVPLYKSMTQDARVKRHEVKVFHAGQPLPPTIPQDAMLFLMNRNFKLAVIDMLCERLPGLLQPLREGTQFIVDYKRAVSYAPGSAAPAPVEGIEHMGESDVKFCRYVTRFGSALVHAIDGDYMAIALLYYAQHGLRPENRMFLFRQLATLEPCKARRPGQAPAKCWVDMQALFAVVAAAARSGSAATALFRGPGSPAYSAGDMVASVVFLMLAAGTDFSRPLPLLGPKRMWAALPDVLPALLQAVRGGPDVDAQLFADGVAGRLYALTFERHAASAPSKRRLAPVMAALQASKLAPATKERLPSPQRVLATVHNLRWVVAYWTEHNGVVATPVDGQYGFVLNGRGQVAFADAPATDAPAPPPPPPKPSRSAPTKARRPAGAATAPPRRPRPRPPA